ncbi:MAG: homospermidine synthase [Moraxellaceae bacterium]|nr:homospermidine synthase [Moraxellaceae bacterium]
MKIPRLPLAGRLVMVGCGSIGQAMLPLLFRHFDITPDRVAILAADVDGSEIARQYQVGYSLLPLTPENFRSVLSPLLGPGDFLLNLSVDVGSADLVQLCAERGVLYLDTSTEPWAGGYTDLARSLDQRSNHALREQVLALRRERGNGPTAVITQGANPGLASAFVKQALLNLAADLQLDSATPRAAEDWARLAHRLGVKVIHVAERDTQLSARRKQRDEFVNTWSVTGFIGEGLQPSELGWGSHEKHWPADAERHAHGTGAAIFLKRPGVATRVRSWTPLEGPYQGFLITHAESISIADHLALYEGGELRYRPTVHYAYYPCDDAVLSLHELAGRNYRAQERKRILRDEISTGMDELGVLLMGHARTAYWFGSRLSIGQARQLAPCNNATSLQVVAGILGGMAWALANPEAGIVEPDDIDHDTVLAVARPYLGDVVGVYSDWTPLAGRSRLYEEGIDAGDPWQFVNFRVT